MTRPTDSMTRGDIAPPGYRVRPATVTDITALVHHRLAMFSEMGLRTDGGVEAAFADWLGAYMPVGTYRAWVVEASDSAIVAGAGITLLPWPPGPHSVSAHLPVVYNVYTEPSHRRRGLAKALMACVHAWCREAGYRRVMLSASSEGRPMYEALGYQVTPRPFMHLTL